MEWVLAIFLFVLGACLGSFLNVVIYRVPHGQSVAFPMRSFCPHCGRTIRGHDNLPILSWLLLRGRCRDCGAEIAPRYLLVELAGGLLTAGLFLAYFVFDLRGAAGPFDTAWPMYAAHAALLLGLLASAVIDAEHFIIPIEVMWLCAGGGFLAAVADPHPFLLAEAGVSPTLAAAAVGALAGLGISAALVHWGYLQPSFLDAENPARMDRPVLEAGDGPLPATAETTPSAEPETGPPAPADPAEAAEAAPEPAEPAEPARPIASDPPDAPDQPAAGDAPSAEHRGPAYTVAATSEWGVDPRREILREVVYLLPALLLAAGAVGLLRVWPAAAQSWDALFRPAAMGGWALSTQAAAASLWGLLIGGAWVWGARIAGTLAFGKEAMGLGDVHLLAAVGAVTGWITPTLVFFIAPFCGLLWALTVWFVHKRRELPYGPWLAAATLIVLLLQDRLLAWILPARSASLP